jgi:hypothetical protein
MDFGWLICWWNKPWPKQLEVKSTVLRILYFSLLVFGGLVGAVIYLTSVPSPWVYIFLPVFIVAGAVLILIGYIFVALIEGFFIKKTNASENPRS